MLVAIPLGLAAAIYLAEYARPAVRKTIKPILELLAGVPTIVFGYFALTFFTPEMLRGLLGTRRGHLQRAVRRHHHRLPDRPTVASISEDSMSAVPQSLREGSFGLGASKLQTTMRVVFPAALSGIVASIVLGHLAGRGRDHGRGDRRRACGHNGPQPDRAHGDHDRLHRLHGKGRHRHRLDRLQDDLRRGSTLFVITLIMNLISIRFVRKYRQVYE